MPPIISVYRWEVKPATSIARLGQGLRGAVDPGDPAGDGLDPLAAVDPAHIGLVDEFVAVLEPGDRCAVDPGGLHLAEVGGDHPEDRHDLGDILVGGQAQGGGGGGEVIALARAQAGRQGAPGLPAEVGTVPLMGAQSMRLGCGAAGRTGPIQLLHPHQLTPAG